MLINRPNLDFLFQQWDARYQTAYEQAQIYYPFYATEMPSGTDRNVHSWLAQQAGLHKWKGPRQIDNAVARDYELKNDDFEKTIGLDANKVKDDQYGVFGPVVDDLGVQAKYWPDDVMTTVIEAGTTEECFDGQPFFDTDHPVDLDDSTKGTYSNNLIGANYDLSADPLKAYRLARAAGMKFVGEGGRSLNVTFDTLMVPPDLETFGLQIANAQLTAQAIKNVAGNETVAAATVTNVYQGAVTVIVNPRLQDQTAAYLMVTKRPIKPFIWQLRQAPNLVALNNPTDYNVFFNKKFLYGVDARGAGGYSFPWMCVRLAPS